MTQAEFLKGTNLYLIGMMGAGKSTTGQLLAKQLGYRFFDTDALIEKAVGQTIPDIFAEQGESGFRQIETQVLSQISAYTRLVVATGGGIVTQQMNWSYLQTGVVIWLDVPLTLLQQRLQEDTTRPLLQTDNWPQTLQDLLKKRTLLYTQADVRVPVSPEDSPETLAARTIELLKQAVRPEALPPEAHPEVNPETPTH